VYAFGFRGNALQGFQKNCLPHAFANPDNISSNLATEVFLGRMAGPLGRFEISGLSNRLGT
jgi:hypothetical protein